MRQQERLHLLRQPGLNTRRCTSHSWVQEDVSDVAGEGRSDQFQIGRRVVSISPDTSPPTQRIEFLKDLIDHFSDSFQAAPAPAVEAKEVSLDCRLHVLIDLVIEHGQDHHLLQHVIAEAPTVTMVITIGGLHAESIACGPCEWDESHVLLISPSGWKNSKLVSLLLEKPKRIASLHLGHSHQLRCQVPEQRCERDKLACF